MSQNDDVVFDHERLKVYQRALDLVEAADRFSIRFTGRRRHLGWQLDRAASSVPLNIAEGNGRSTGPDRSHFLLIALGSTLECAAIMDIAERLGVGTPEQRGGIREIANDIVKMLLVLSRNTRHRPRTSPGRRYS